MDLRAIFAYNLRMLRRKKCMSQEDFACAVGMSRSYLCHLEKGAFYASLKMIGRFADVLKVPPDEFFRAITPIKRRKGD